MPPRPYEIGRKQDRVRRAADRFVPFLHSAATSEVALERDGVIVLGVVRREEQRDPAATDGAGRAMKSQPFSRTFASARGRRGPPPRARYRRERADLHGRRSSRRPRGRAGPSESVRRRRGLLQEYAIEIISRRRNHGLPI